MLKETKQVEKYREEIITNIKIQFQDFIASIKRY